MITCIAIDDEPNALEVIQILSSKVGSLELKETFTDPLEAINYLKSNTIDFLFLDINMPELTGFNVLSLLPDHVDVIFTTAYSEHAVKSYEVNAVDYLLKPFTLARFIQAVDKVKKSKNAEQESLNEDFFFVNTGTSKQKILLREIQYIESDGNYVYYVTQTQKLMVRASIKEILKSLPRNRFIQVQRSFAIAFSWIKKIESNHVYIADREIPIGKTFKVDFQSALKKFS